MHTSVNIEGALDARVINVLRDVPGVAVSAQPSGRGGLADATIAYAGRESTVAIEFKRYVNAASAWQLVKLAETSIDGPLLVVAVDSTRDGRRILQDHRIGIIDGSGRAHLELPGLLFHRAEPRRRGGGRFQQRARLSGKAGVVAQALLLDPGVEWHVRDLAEAAAVSPSLAHRVLARLEDDGLVLSKGKGPQRVRTTTNPTALLDLWIEENDDRAQRVSGYRLAQTTASLAEAVCRDLDAADIDYALTGPAAADLVAPFATGFNTVTLWVTELATPAAALTAAAVEPAGSGYNIEFKQTKDDVALAFRVRGRRGWMVNAMRLYADLSADPQRGREQAEHLRREVLQL